MANDGPKRAIEILVGHCLGGVGNDVYPGTKMVVPDQLSLADAEAKVAMGYAKWFVQGQPGPGGVAMPLPGPDAVPTSDTETGEVAAEAEATELDGPGKPRKVNKSRARSAGGRNLE